MKGKIYRISTSVELYGNISRKVFSVIPKVLRLGLSENGIFGSLYRDFNRTAKGKYKGQQMIHSWSKVFKKCMRGERTALSGLNMHYLNLAN